MVQQDSDFRLESCISAMRAEVPSALIRGYGFIRWRISAMRAEVPSALMRGYGLLT